MIYYHKGSETWGKPFTTKTNDPSVLSLKIELSPNPSSGILKISTSELFDNIKIMNLSGKVVFNDKNVPTTKCQIVLQDLPNGLYFAQVFKNQTLISIGKFVLNR